MLLGLSVVNSFNSAQDAPKGKKTATLADDFLGTIGSIAIATPLAFMATYKIATLNNLKGTNTFSKILKKLGGIVNVGLDKPLGNGQYIEQVAKSNTFFGKLGHNAKSLWGYGFRFYLLMSGFSSLFMKPIKI